LIGAAVYPFRAVKPDGAPGRLSFSGRSVCATENGCQETDMKRPKETLKHLPQHDYALALRNAVSWLGDRYLLAQPVVRSVATPQTYFTETRSWHDALKSVETP
jgi:hypothetical protein